MALILDTRFLVAHAFPPSREDREMLLEFQRKLAEESLLIPSIVVAEFIKVAGPRLGLAAAKTAVRNWVRAGARVTEITWEDAEQAVTRGTRAQHGKGFLFERDVKTERAEKWLSSVERLKSTRAFLLFREARESAKKNAVDEGGKTAPPETTKYLELFRKYLAEAEELYRRGDLPQSGEKYWGAQRPPQRHS